MVYTNKNIEEIKNWLKENLDIKRYEHSIATADCAQHLAERYGLDVEKAYIAGLLHDCAKCFSNTKLLEIIDNFIPEVLDIEKENYKTLHAPVSSYVANTKFGVTDPEILSAIRLHTIGKIEMTDFEKIIYLADKIEHKTRKLEYRQKIEPFLAEENGLNKAMLASYKETIKSLCDRDLRICPLTIDIYNSLEKIINV